MANGHRRIGVMGGTFDPVHHGHLVAGSEVAHIFALDEVIFVPTGQPYQKDDRKVSRAEDRYLMTVIATASNPRFSVSRVDIDRPGPTYTIDTLRDLHEANGPDADLYFITGADALENILTWHDVDTLFSLAHFVGCTRPGPPADRRRACLTARSPWWRSRRWRSPAASAAPGWPRTSRSGTWCPMASCSTSPSATCTAAAPPSETAPVSSPEPVVRS